MEIENDRSRKVAEWLGFTQEGILRQSWWTRDRYVDLVVYGLLVSEWQGEKSVSTVVMQPSNKGCTTWEIEKLRR